MTLDIFARSDLGLRMMKIRPVFLPELAPPPMTEMELSTLGSALTIAAALSCNSSIALKEMSSEASAVGRAGAPDEVGELAALLMSEAGAFITGSDILMDGGVTAAYFYGSLAI